MLDRFHIMSHFSKALDEVRAAETRKLAAEGRAPVLKRSRWLLLKRPENLTDAQSERLAERVRRNLAPTCSRRTSRRCGTMSRRTGRGASARHPRGSGDRWCTRTMRSRLDPMKRVARMMRSHRELILNWFRARGALSNGIVEGFNGKARVTTKKAFGYRTCEALEIALYHTLGDLPEPGLTHRFC